MSFGAIRSALRLHKQRIAPKWRYGVAAVVAAGAGTAYYKWRRAERILWSDELKPDPPLPQKYEHKYRLGAHLINLDMPSSAWNPLNEAWQSALDDGADPAVLAAIAVMLLQAKAPADAKHAVGARTLDRLLRAGWDDVLPRERERAVLLALMASEDGGDIAGWPFLQWAWAQAWHLAVLDAPQMQSPRLASLLADAGESRRILDVMPFAIVVAERFEDRRREGGLGQVQLCLLGRLYNTLAFNLLVCGPPWFTTAHQFNIRALKALRPPTNPVPDKVIDLYKSQLSQTAFQIGLVCEYIGHVEEALEQYSAAYHLLPDEDPLKGLVHTNMLRAKLEAQRAADASKKT